MSVELELHGADELVADMQKLIDTAPEALDRAMMRAAKGFTEDCNELMPAGYSFRKTWKRHKVTGDFGITSAIEVRNAAPHWHLVENGHVKWINGTNTGGFVPGKHIAERIRDEYQDKYPEIVGAAVARAMAEVGL